MPHQLPSARIRRNTCAFLGTALLAVSAPAAAGAATTASQGARTPGASGLRSHGAKGATTLPNGLVLRILPYSRD